MDDQESQNSKPIGVVLGVFMMMLCIVADLISIIPGAGDVEDVAGVLGFILGLVSNVGALISTTLGIAVAIKAIPGVQIVPAWTIGWGFVWITTNNPSSVGNLALQAAQMAGGGEEGALEEGEAAGAMANSAEGMGAMEGTAEGAGGALETEGGYSANNGGAPEGERGSTETTNRRNAGADREEMEGESRLNEEGEDFDMPDYGDKKSDEEEGERNDLVPEAERSPMAVEQEELFGAPPGMDYTDWNGGSGAKNGQDDEDEGYAEAA